MILTLKRYVERRDLALEYARGRYKAQIISRNEISLERYRLNESSQESYHILVPQARSLKRVEIDLYINWVHFISHLQQDLSINSWCFKHNIRTRILSKISSVIFSELLSQMKYVYHREIENIVSSECIYGVPRDIPERSRKSGIVFFHPPRT